jgi:hypothetical protein
LSGCQVVEDFQIIRFSKTEGIATKKLKEHERGSAKEYIHEPEFDALPEERWFIVAWKRGGA